MVDKEAVHWYGRFSAIRMHGVTCATRRCLRLAASRGPGVPLGWTESCPVSVPRLQAPLPEPEWSPVQASQSQIIQKRKHVSVHRDKSDKNMSPVVAEEHPVPVGRWAERILLVDWSSERPVVSLWEAGCHSDPGTELEYRAGTALMTELL